MGAVQLDPLRLKAGARGRGRPGVAAKWAGVDGALVSGRAPAGPAPASCGSADASRGAALSAEPASLPASGLPRRAADLGERTEEAALLKVNHRLQLPFPREAGGGRERGRASARAPVCVCKGETTRGERKSLRSPPKANKPEMD